MVFDTVFSGGPILGSVNEFIDYAQFVVIILIIYYVIKLFTVGGKTPAERDAEGTDFMDYVKEKTEGRKRKAEEAAVKEKREKEIKECENLLNFPKSRVILAEQKCDEVLDELRTRSVAHLARANSALAQVEQHLQSAKRSLRGCRVKSKADRRTYIGKLEAYVDSLQQIISSNVRAAMPVNDTNPPWNSRVTSVRTALGRVKSGCGYLIHSMDKFMEDCSTPVIDPIPGGPSPGPSGGPSGAGPGTP